MPWSKLARRQTTRLSYLLAITAAVGVSLLGAAYERRVQDGVRSNVGNRLGLIRAEFERAVGVDVALLRGVGVALGLDPGMSPDRISSLAARIRNGSSSIRALAVAPDLVIGSVEPLAGHQASLGVDLRASAARRTFLEIARGGVTAVLAGPVDFAQDDHGFAAAVPVFAGGRREERRFWGLVLALIDEAALLQDAAIADPDLPLDVTIIRRDTPDGLPLPIYGNPAVLAAEPVRLPLDVPSATWEIAAVPKQGWTAEADVRAARWLFAAAGVLIALPIVGFGRLIAARQVQVGVIRAREAELSQLSWRLEFALATSNVGVWDADLETDELHWDDRAKAIFGIAGHKTRFAGDLWKEILHPDDRSRVIAQADQAVTDSARFMSEYRIVRHGGDVRHIRDTAAVYRASDGKRRLVGLVWDVTPDVERQEELNLRRVEAETATVAKSRFLAAMSHEIRTPLSGVLGLLGLTLDAPLPPQQRERIAIALKSPRGLLHILNDVLDFSKLEAGQIRIRNESVAIRNTVSEVMGLMAAGAEQKGIVLGSHVADDVPDRVLVDPLRLRQVLTNLISNATKFTEAGEISLRARWRDDGDGGRLDVEVQDSGTGIDEAQREVIFQHFVQADNAHDRRVGGAGLGLAICKQLVGLMGGEISVRSVPGMGSTFAFHVRARPAAPVAALPKPERPVGQVVLPPLRVLLAEDHPTNQYLMRAYLRTGGHQVVVVENGAQAIEHVLAEHYDVVLMDVQMPVVDGLAATRRIRNLAGAAASVPIIALTANAMPEDRVACLAAGMSDYLSKPVDPVALSAALERARSTLGTVEERRADVAGGRHAC